MKNIKILSQSIAQKIAAGEVVEQPSSVVKELLENSIDAGSTFITVEIQEGGKKLIRVSDNGSGIYPGDVTLAFVRHATSKIEKEEDLYNILQMGFRGEALYSISAVSKTTLLSKTKEFENGQKIIVHGGEIIENTETGAPNGTTVVIEDLFYNTPARLKFMKSNAAETSKIASIVQKIILSRPAISIKLIVNDAIIYQSSGDGNLINAIHSIYGKKIATNIIEFDTMIENIHIYGALGNKEVVRSSRINQTIFTNQRYVKDKNLNHMIESAYGSLLMKGKFPFYVVFIDVDTHEVDVNVHPQKLFIKFSNQKTVENAVYEAIKLYTHKMGAVPDILTEKNQSTKPINSIRRTHSYEQNHITSSDIESTEKKKNDTNIDTSFAPRKYDYKRELEFKKSMAAPLVMKQSSSEHIIEQKSYLEENFEGKILGTVFSSYIVIEYDQIIYFIDQHAAHERLLYEKLYAQYQESNIISQSLLIPQVIEITYEEELILNENIQYFRSLGFEFENITKNKVTLIAVPHILGQPKFQNFFVELFDLLAKESLDENSIIKKIISVSCKKAVKAGDTLDNYEISQLLVNIKDEDIPLTCPHGRPFIMKLTKKQIDKKAGRI